MKKILNIDFFLSFLRCYIILMKGELCEGHHKLEIFYGELCNRNVYFSCFYLYDARRLNRRRHIIPNTRYSQWRSYVLFLSKEGIVSARS